MLMMVMISSQQKIQDSFASESVPLDVANKTNLVTKNVCQNVVSHDDLLNQQHLHHHRPPPFDIFSSICDLCLLSSIYISIEPTAKFSSICVYQHHTFVIVDINTGRMVHLINFQHISKNHEHNII